MCVLSASQISGELEQIAAQYPEITDLCLEGYSEDGRPVHSIAVGNGSAALICTGGVHGRESINPTALVKMTKDYCEKYTRDSAENREFTADGESRPPSVREMLQRYQIRILPLLNPDGYEIARRGFDAVKAPELRKRLFASAGMMEHPDETDSKGQHAVWETAKEWKLNACGKDINRNFPCQSYRKQTDGDFPFSEAESRILAHIFQREDSIGYIDFHSRGREIYWYRAALDENYNRRQKFLAEFLADSCQYRVGTPEDELQEPYSGGNTVQYYSEQYHLPAITIETVPEEAVFPLEERWLEITYQEIKEIPLQYLYAVSQEKKKG